MYLSPYYILNVDEDTPMDTVEKNYIKLKKKYKHDDKMSYILNTAFNEIKDNLTLNKMTNYNRDYTFNVPNIFSKNGLMKGFEDDAFDSPKSFFSQSSVSHSYTDMNGNIITKTENITNNNGKVDKTQQNFINNKPIENFQKFIKK